MRPVALVVLLTWNALCWETLAFVSAHGAAAVIASSIRERGGGGGGDVGRAQPAPRLRAGECRQEWQGCFSYWGGRSSALRMGAGGESETGEEAASAGDGFKDMFTNAGTEGVDSSTWKGFGAKPEPKEEGKEEDTDKRRKTPKKKGSSDKKSPIGVLLEKGDEAIRELSSEEYLFALQDWSPMAAFAGRELKDNAVIGEEAENALEALRGMAQWKPARSSDFTQMSSGWAFGAPVGAFKGGILDAVACLQINEGGIIIEHIAESPRYLGVESNCAQWLASGIAALAGRKLDMSVRLADSVVGIVLPEQEQGKQGEQGEQGEQGGGKGKGL